MAQKTNQQNSNSTAGVGAAAAGLGAALAAAAGAYWLYGAKDATKHRRLAQSWMLKARAQVMDAVEKLPNVDKKQYLAIVDRVVGGYAAIAGVTRPEITRLAQDLKQAWNHISTETKKGTKQGGKSTRRSAKPAAQTAKKAAKK